MERLDPFPLPPLLSASLSETSIYPCLHSGQEFHRVIRVLLQGLRSVLWGPNVRQFSLGGNLWTSEDQLSINAR